MNNKIYLAAFIVLCLVQLGVLSSMIFQKETILSEGKAFRFECYPIDPADPFRGKYITLNFKENSLNIAAENWQVGETVYVELQEGPDRMAKLVGLARSPSPDNYSLEARIQRVAASEKKVFIRLPFTRYYMEESKAADAERLYLEALQNQEEQQVYALVLVDKKGQSVLKEVFVNGVPIRELVKRQRDKAN